MNGGARGVDSLRTCRGRRWFRSGLESSSVWHSVSRVGDFEWTGSLWPFTRRPFVPFVEGVAVGIVCDVECFEASMSCTSIITIIALLFVGIIVPPFRDAGAAYAGPLPILAAVDDEVQPRLSDWIAAAVVLAPKQTTSFHRMGSVEVALPKVRVTVIETSDAHDLRSKVQLQKRAYM